MKLSLRHFIIATSLFISLSVGLGVIISTPMPAQAAGNYCINSEGNIQPDNLAYCLDPEPANSQGQNYAWITTIWKWSLSLVNVFAALVLIIIAFANILSPIKALEQFQIRHSLPTFIAGIVFANASLFICRAVVSIADLLMSKSGFQFSLEQLYTAWGFDPGLLPLGTIASVYGFNGPSTFGDLFFQLIISNILIWLPLIGMIALSFIFYFRTALIFVLTAVSPLAFASIIFPPTRGMLNRWWDTFWKWTFGGVAAWFVLYIATLITVSDKTLSQGGITTDALSYIVSLSLTYIAIMAPFKLGGAIAATIQQLTRKGAGYGMQATKFAGREGWKGYGSAMVPIMDRASRLQEAGAEQIARGGLRNRIIGNSKTIFGKVVKSSNLYGLGEARELSKKGAERRRMNAARGGGLWQKQAGREEATRHFLSENVDRYRYMDTAGLDNAIAKYGNDKAFKGNEDEWREFLYGSPARTSAIGAGWGLSAENAANLKLSVAQLRYSENQQGRRSGLIKDTLDESRRRYGGHPAGGTVGEKTSFSPLEKAQNQLQGINLTTTNAPHLHQALISGDVDQFTRAVQYHHSQGVSQTDLARSIEAFDEYQVSQNRPSAKQEIATKLNTMSQASAPLIDKAAGRPSETARPPLAPKQKNYVPPARPRDTSPGLNSDYNPATNSFKTPAQIAVPHTENEAVLTRQPAPVTRPVAAPAAAPAPTPPPAAPLQVGSEAAKRSAPVTEPHTPDMEI